MSQLLFVTFLFIALSLGGCKNKQEDIWIDVRTQEEFDQGHLVEAKLIPHEQIAARIAEVTSDKDATIHVYCRAGTRAGKAKTALDALGFKNVINEGGYNDIVERRKTQ